MTRPPHVRPGIGARRIAIAFGSALTGFTVMSIGCGGSSPKRVPITQATRAFLSQQGLPKQQEPRGRLVDRDNQTYLFDVSFGPPQDCPSGCFYLNAVGINRADKAGWITMDRTDPTVETSRYDFDASDTYLFSDEFDRKLRSLPYTEVGSIYEDFKLALLQDSDTPAFALLRIMRQLQNNQIVYTYVADDLFRNPNARTNRDVLTILANLPSRVPVDAPESADLYREIRAEAARLLIALGT